MKDTYMTIKLDAPLRERVEDLAKTERRSLADQAAYLMEKGLIWLEKQDFSEKRPLDAAASAGEMLSGAALERRERAALAEEAAG
jgi:predicted transcriptional regulator